MHVGGHASGAHAGVEDEVRTLLAFVDGDQHGEAVLGVQGVDGLALFEEGFGEAGHVWAAEITPTLLAGP